MKDHTIEQIRTTCTDIVARDGKSSVAAACNVSRQAIGQAIMQHDNIFKYYDLRLKIMAIDGFSLVGGPFVQLEKKKQS
jgi:hypothetical protein